MTLTFNTQTHPDRQTAERGRNDVKLDKVLSSMEYISLDIHFLNEVDDHGGTDLYYSKISLFFLVKFEERPTALWPSSLRA